MKTIKLILLLATLTTQAQNKISYSILQDTKLAFGLDTEHKNNTPTLDAIFNINLEGKQFKYYYFSTQIQYEHANLYQNYYSRYGVNLIWVFNQLIIPKLKIGAGAGLHMINRATKPGNGSYSATLEINYPILKRLSIISKNEWVRRSDLITPKLGYNLSFGLKFN